MISYNNVFEIKCIDQSIQNIDFNITPLHFINIFSHNNIQLEISVVTYTLGSGIEIGMFQRFIKQNQKVLSTVPNGELMKIKYPKNSFKHENEIQEVVQDLYKYLCSLMYNGIIYLVTGPSYAKLLKQLFTDAQFKFPQIIKLIKLDSLLDTTLNFFGKQSPKENIVNIERNTENFPKQQTCPYHLASKKFCITKKERKHCYTIHAILKQCGLNVEGTFILLNLQKKKKQPKPQPNPKPKLIPKPKSELPNTLTPKLRVIFNEFFPNIYIHFLDFKYAYSLNERHIPNEIGISTYNLVGNNEFEWFHAFIYPGEYINEMKGPMKFHGIDPRNTYIPFKNINDVKNELYTYFYKYQSVKFVCVKGEVVGGDYKCLKDLMGIIPPDICVITHIQLFEMICKNYKVSLPPKYSISLHSTYKQLKTYQRCEFHEPLEKQFRCGLGDSRSTALMIMIEMRYVGILVNNVEQLPIVKRIPTTFNIINNNFLFINVDKYNDSKKEQVSEIVMSKVTFNNYQIQTCDSSAFQYLLPEDGIQSEEQIIIQKFFIQNNYTSNAIIYQHLQSVIDSGDDNQVIVFLDGSLNRIIQSLSFDNYLCVNKETFLKQFITEINGSCNIQNMCNLIHYLDKLPNNSNNKHCGFLHNENYKRCSFWKFTHFKFILEHLLTNYPLIINTFINDSQQPKKKKGKSKKHK